jgi:hypothetical protein
MVKRGEGGYTVLLVAFHFIVLVFQESVEKAFGMLEA